jgi:hypothetical protein
MPIRRYASHYSNIGIVIDEAPAEKISYCSTCMAVGELSRLRERIWLDDKGKRLPDPPNAEDFKMCWTCGLVVPVREVKIQGKISGIQGIETVDNPFDSQKSFIIGNDSKHRYQRLRKKQSKRPDAEVQRLIDQGYELIAYSQDIPT